MSNFRELTNSADDIVLDAFAEEVHVNGHCVKAIVNDDEYETPSLDVPVEGRAIVLMFRTEDVRRFKITKGTSIEVRGTTYTANEPRPDTYAMSRVECEA